MIFVFAVIVIGAAIAVAVLLSRHRPDGSIESGIHSFRREMRAIAPPEDDPTYIPPYRPSTGVTEPDTSGPDTSDPDSSEPGSGDSDEPPGGSDGSDAGPGDDGTGTGGDS